MTRALLFVLCLVAAGCSLRPRYNDFGLSLDEGLTEARFVVIDGDTGAPVPGARIEVGEQRSRVITVSGADGTFVLPVDRRYVEENPIFVVTLPKGVVSYRVELFHETKPVETPAAPVEAAPETTPADSTETTL